MADLCLRLSSMAAVFELILHEFGRVSAEQSLLGQSWSG